MRRPGAARGGVLALAPAALVGLAVASLAGCRDDVQAAAAARVRGTTVDAATGEPVVGVRVHGPRDACAVSDVHGRFELRGLRAGDAGTLEARREPGPAGAPALEARLPLHPLRPGVLEVVFRLDPVRDDPAPETGPDRPSGGR